MYMESVRLRGLLESDLDVLTANETPESDPWNCFEIGASNRFHRRFADNGGIGHDTGHGTAGLLRLYAE